jgi:hypothetical protein
MLAFYKTNLLTTACLDVLTQFFAGSLVAQLYHCVCCILTLCPTKDEANQPDDVSKLELTLTCKYARSSADGLTDTTFSSTIASISSNSRSSAQIGYQRITVVLYVSLICSSVILTPPSIFDLYAE